MFKKIVTIGVMATIISTSLFAQKEALLVGVGEYRSNRIVYLGGVKQDIDKMKTLLEKRGFHVTVLLNKEATIENVRNAFKRYYKLKNNDVFVFYDSSHGVQIPDQNGDEDDELDEAYALYNTEVDNYGVVNPNGILVDDELEMFLSKIPAKKLLISDACHSGTIYKGLGIVRVKGLNLSKNFKQRTILGEVPKVKDLISISATEASEQSLETEDGGMFTNAIYDAMSSNPNITFKDLQIQATNHITDRCERLQAQGLNTAIEFHPSLYATNNRLLYQPINSYIQSRSRFNKHLVEEYLNGLMNNHKVGHLSVTTTSSQYQRGENIYFTINTHGKRGYLYVIATSENSNDIDVVYPNSYYRENEPISGVIHFPQPNTFNFKATNDSGNRFERTLVYTILSDKKIPELEFNGNRNYNSFKSILKNFTGQSSLKNSLKDIILQRKEGVEIYIAKREFRVY